MDLSLPLQHTSAYIEEAIQKPEESQCPYRNLYAQHVFRILKVEYPQQQPLTIFRITCTIFGLGLDRLDSLGVWLRIWYFLLDPAAPARVANFHVSAWEVEANSGIYGHVLLRRKLQRRARPADPQAISAFQKSSCSSPPDGPHTIPAYSEDHTSTHFAVPAFGSLLGSSSSSSSSVDGLILKFRGGGKRGRRPGELQLRAGQKKSRHRISEQQRREKWQEAFTLLKELTGQPQALHSQKKCEEYEKGNEWSEEFLAQRKLQLLQLAAMEGFPLPKFERQNCVVNNLVRIIYEFPNHHPSSIDHPSPRPQPSGYETPVARLCLRGGGPGRPKGSKNKIKDPNAPPPLRRGRGRPRGARNKNTISLFGTLGSANYAQSPQGIVLLNTADEENVKSPYFSPLSRNIASPPPSGSLSVESFRDGTPEDPLVAEFDGEGSSRQDESTLWKTMRNSGRVESTLQGATLDFTQSSQATVVHKPALNSAPSSESTATHSSAPTSSIKPSFIKRLSALVPPPQVIDVHSQFRSGYGDAITSAPAAPGPPLNRNNTISIAISSRLGPVPGASRSGYWETILSTNASSPCLHTGDNTNNVATLSRQCPVPSPFRPGYSGKDTPSPAASIPPFQRKNHINSVDTLCGRKLAASGGADDGSVLAAIQLNLRGGGGSGSRRYPSPKSKPGGPNAPQRFEFVHVQFRSGHGDTTISASDSPDPPLNRNNNTDSIATSYRTGPKPGLFQTGYWGIIAPDPATPPPLHRNVSNNNIDSMVTSSGKGPVLGLFQPGYWGTISPAPVSPPPLGRDKIAHSVANSNEKGPPLGLFRPGYWGTISSTPASPPLHRDKNTDSVATSSGKGPVLGLFRPSYWGTITDTKAAQSSPLPMVTNAESNVTPSRTTSISLGALGDVSNDNTTESVVTTRTTSVASGALGDVSNDGTDDSTEFSTRDIIEHSANILSPSSVAAGTIPPPLPPSVEEAYRKKCIELKRRMTDVEESNDAYRLRKARLTRGIRKMRLERAYLLEILGKRMKKNGSSVDGYQGFYDEDSEGSSEGPPTVCLSVFKQLPYLLLLNPIIFSRMKSLSVLNAATAGPSAHHLPC